MSSVHLLEWPQERDWWEVKRRALVTVGLNPVSPPSMEWRRKILEARHSPIRYLRFAFLSTDMPYWLSVHLARHIHAQPYVKSQRNDRQDAYDRNSAPQDAPVSMIWDVNAEELMTIANKRLCTKAAPETRAVVLKMCKAVLAKCPEFSGLLVPMCDYHGGHCHEMEPCGRREVGK